MLVVELVEVNAGLREMIAAQDHRIASLKAQTAESQRRLNADSSTSSRPPSSDSPYRKLRRRSSRKSSGRRPGKQPGIRGRRCRWWMARMRSSSAIRAAVVAQLHHLWSTRSPSRPARSAPRGSRHHLDAQPGHPSRGGMQRPVRGIG